MQSVLYFIRPRYVLTAAHCFCGGILLDCHYSTQFPSTPWIFHLDNKRERQGSRVEVAFPSVTQVKDGNNNSTEDMQSFTVRRVIVYHKYVQQESSSNLISQTNVDNADVALLELDLPQGISRSYSNGSHWGKNPLFIQKFP